MIAPYTMWLRTESPVLAGGSESGISIIRQPPPGGCRLKYHVTGPAGSVKIDVYGEQDEHPVQETVSFTAPRWYLGTKTFTKISNIAFEGLQNGNEIKIEAVNSSGNPLAVTTIDGPYAISIRRMPRDAERIAEAGEARTTHELYICANDEEGLQVIPGQRFTVSELPGLELEVWSAMKLVASPLGETVLKREFLARRISP
jgi:hypothetical protein